MRRRRFLALTAAALAAPRRGRAEIQWRGRAFGADCALTLRGPERDAARALAALPALIETIEAEFSLHRPSALTRLNASGRLEAPSPAFRALLTLADRAHRLTDGAFDPSVQPRWRALAEGKPPEGPVGWARVGLAPAVTLEPGMALTFNGVAQGFGADAVAALLASHGFEEALIDMGEVAALGGPFRIGLADPAHGLLGTRSLTGRALATSSPGATLVNGSPHILHPRGLRPLWSSVTVEAASAALADALSTGLVFLERDRIAALARPAGIRVTLVDPAGDLETI
jgi:thiamine biosynthesis lipoprotein